MWVACGSRAAFNVRWSEHPPGSRLCTPVSTRLTPSWVMPSSRSVGVSPPCVCCC